jgi:3,4-dihydroxy 2-butanone 4-phosphate synthase
MSIQSSHPQSHEPHARVRQAIDAMRAGRFVLVQDDHDRENEADLICAAELLTIEQMAALIRDCSGIVCLCITQEKADQLGLRPMVPVNRSRFGTGFTASVEAAEGVSTGVSAQDRVSTVRAVLDSTMEECKVVSPGHIFPIVAKRGGVLERRGHTEASVDLAVLAGLAPASVLCELMNPDGSMARGEQVAAYGRLHGIAIVSVEELAQYRADIGVFKTAA